MSNQFIRAVKTAIDKHGLSSTYRAITEGTYDVNTGSTTNTQTDYTVKMYMKNISANQFNYPNLIGRESGLFYVSAYNLAFTPAINDYIIYNSKTYKVDSIQSHSAAGLITLYRILAVV